MKIKITAVRFKDIAWTGGTFRKYECKTDKTGDTILELRLGKDANAKAKVGDVIEGYIEDGFYMGKNGKVDTKTLKRISAEYVYKLVLKLDPNIEGVTTAETLPEPPPEEEKYLSPEDQLEINF